MSSVEPDLAFFYIFIFPPRDLTGWDGTSRDGMGWTATGRDGMEWDGTYDGMELDFTGWKNLAESNELSRDGT